ncbi:hypothetical protein pb186bvf_009619 [Paramecium bursaria]
MITIVVVKELFHEFLYEKSINHLYKLLNYGILKYKLLKKFQIILQNLMNQDQGKRSNLQWTINTKKQLKKDLEKLDARVNKLQQDEQKNLMIAKMYEIAAEKVLVGKKLRRQMYQLKSEADLLSKQEFEKKKQLINEIKQREAEFIKYQEQKRDQGLSQRSKLKQSLYKEYKSTLRESMVKTQTFIGSENQKTHDELRKIELERRNKIKELQASNSKKGQENYESKVTREFEIVKQIQSRVKDLEKDEQILLNRLKKTQEIAQMSQKRFKEIQQSPITKLDDI